MAGKRSRRRQNAARRTDVKEVADAVAAKCRKQILAADELLDVFACTTRVDLDQWGTVTRTFGRLTQRAVPLRELQNASLHFDRSKQVFVATAHPYHDVEKRMVAADLNSDLRKFFFGCLRFSYILWGARIRNISIDCSFLKHLRKTIGPLDLDCKGLRLNHITLGEGIDPLDVFAAFPGVPLNLLYTGVATFKFLVGDSGVNGTLLRSFATRGIWDVDIPIYWKTGLNSLDGLPPTLSISEEAILDFAFGDYKAGKKKRCLRVPYNMDVSSVMLTPQILANLVKVCRDCESAHPLEVGLSVTGVNFHPEHPAADMAEEASAFAGKYKLNLWDGDDWDEVLPDGCTWWTFRFNDMPDVQLEYMRMLPNGKYSGLVRIYLRRHCTEPSFFILRSTNVPNE